MTLPIHAKQEDSFSVCPQYTDIPPLPHLAHILLISQTATLVIHTPGIMHTTGFFFCRGSLSLSLSLSLSPQQTALTSHHHSLHQLNTSTEHNEDQNFETVTSLIFLCSSLNLADGGLRLVVDSCIAAQGSSNGRARSSALKAKTSFVSGAPSPTATKKYFAPLAPPAPLVQGKWL